MEVLEGLTSLDLFISVDSGFLHTATGLGITTLGIYITTSPIIWGGYSSFFNSVKSPHMDSCEFFDKNLGMCRNGRDECPLVTANTDGIEVKDILSKINLIAKYATIRII